MWNWEWERRRRAGEQQAQVGRVSIGGGEPAVELGGERRWLRLCTPGPLRWRPAAQEQVLVLRTGEEEPPCVLGVVQEDEALPTVDADLSAVPTAELRRMLEVGR